MFEQQDRIRIVFELKIVGGRILYSKVKPEAERTRAISIQRWRRLILMNNQMAIKGIREVFSISFSALS